jgi:mannose-6-phosphate isomerase-like protein (cupin superfamily)
LAARGARTRATACGIDEHFWRQTGLIGRRSFVQIGPTQKVPWHYHTNVHDTFYVVTGAIRIFLQGPKEEVRLTAGQTYSVPPKRPHLVTNAGDASAVFLVLQGIGEYDFVPLADARTGERGRKNSDVKKSL